MIMLIQGGFLMAQETVVTPNGKKVQVNTKADNGLSATGGSVQLGGALLKPTVLTTTGFTFAIEGLSPGLLTDDVILADPSTGILKKINASSLSGAGSFWSIVGNSATDPALNFLGTKDDKPLMFRIHDTNAGFLSKKYTALGYDAYNTTSTGLANTAIGVSSLKANTSGNSNTAIGFWTLMTNTIGVANTAVGSSALRLNTDGQSNTAVGTVAMQDNTTGTANTAVGGSALTRNISGNWNTAIGASALNVSTGDSNTAVGHFASYNNLGGKQNTSVGNYALQINTLGNNNTAFGYESGRNIGGNNNVAIGNQVLTRNNIFDDVTYSGNYNIAIGDNIKLSSKTVSNELNIGNALFGKNVNSTIGTAKIGVNIQAPGTAFHVKPAATGEDPVTVEGLKAGSTTDKIVVVDTNGVLKTIGQASGLMKIKRTSTPVTLSESDDDVLLVNATSDNLIITVPAGISKGKVFTIKRVDSSKNTVTIIFEGSGATIDETDIYIYVGNKVTYQIITEGSNKWQTISRV